MLAYLSGFSPRIQNTFVSPCRALPHWSPRTGIDADLTHLEHNPNLAAKIMRKRQQERERNNNRLTPRMQRIGLDITALNGQVADKKAAVEAKRGEDEQYLELMQVKSEIATQGDSIIKEDMRQKQRECVNYSFANLSRHQRREWDLSDPNQLKKEKPSRIEGITPNISSMQRFEGEDGVSPEKLKEKRDVQVNWLMAQMAEKRLQAELDKKIDKHNDATLLAADGLRDACEVAYAQERHEEVMENARINQAMASARRERQAAAKEREKDLKRDHVKTASEYNLMRERHDYSIGLNGKKRDYKRCSYEEEQGAWDINRQMVQAKIDRKHSEDHLNDEYVQIGETFDELGKAYDDAWKNMNLNRRKQINEQNRIMAQERKEREAEEKAEYTSFTASPRKPFAGSPRMPFAGSPRMPLAGSPR